MTTAPAIIVPDDDAQRKAECALLFERLKRTVLAYWPAYWPLVEALLSLAATLSFKNVPAAIAVFATGESGVGKNTVFKMFGWTLPHVILWRDKFTLAALQSHHADSKKAVLNSRALFRLAKHKMLITPELGLLFRGRTHILEERFGELAQWLDGEGRVTDSGTKGELGEKSDFTFVWAAGTTPFQMEMWRTMAALGTRLLFFEVQKGPYVPDDVYPVALGACRDAVNEFLDSFLPENSFRTRAWPEMDAQCDKVIQHYAALLALGHGMRSNLLEEEGHFPSPNHFRSRLGLLVRGRAAVYSRTQVIAEDLEMARWITRSSMPGRRGQVLIALYEGCTQIGEIASSTGLSVSTVTATLKSLVQTGVVEELGKDGVVGRPPMRYGINDALLQTKL